jgi:hypothetical protein
LYFVDVQDHARSRAAGPSAAPSVFSQTYYYRQFAPATEAFSSAGNAQLQARRVWSTILLATRNVKGVLPNAAQIFRLRSARLLNRSY